MRSLVWSKACRASTDPPRAKHFFDLLAATSAGHLLERVSLEQARVLAALFSGSQALSKLLIAQPSLLEAVAPEALKFPRRKQGLKNELDASLGPPMDGRDYAAALARVRQFKQREMLRLAARDLSRLGPVSEITQEISDVADV